MFKLSPFVCFVISIPCVCGLLEGCAPSHISHPGYQKLVLESTETQYIELYKKTTPLIPLVRLKAPSQVWLREGSYLLATTCSSKTIDLRASESAVRVRLTSVAFTGPEGPDATTPTILPLQCEHPADQHAVKFSKDIRQIWSLPGSPVLWIANQPLTLHVPQLSVVDLSGLEVLDLLKASDTFFVFQPTHVTKSAANDQNTRDQVFAAPTNTVLWLAPGDYTLEINGTQAAVHLEQGKLTQLQLGHLRFKTPEDFPSAERSAHGQDPVFMYLNHHVLLNLNTDYPVFPGEYIAQISDSDMEKNLTVTGGTRLDVFTQTAWIVSPPCPTGQTCKPPPLLTVHKNRQAYPLMHVQANVPFLIFDEPYEYAVDDMKGLFKAVPIWHAGKEPESLSRISIEWQKKASHNNLSLKTSFVRLEAKGGQGVVGKSLDLLFFRPAEVYLPSGTYQLSYLVEDLSSARMSRQVTPLSLSQNGQLSVAIPEYMPTCSDCTPTVLHTEEAPKSLGNSDVSQSLPTRHVLKPVGSNGQ